MTQPLVLDLFCCAGGAARGYQRAGFRVIGVDIEPRPNYCGDEFVQMDAVEYMQKALRSPSFAFAPPSLIHWSPPCQEKSALKVGTNNSRGWGSDHVDMIPIMRPLIEKTGLPNVLEQPAGKAKMRRDLMLCMDMEAWQRVKPPWVQRHRYFEINGFSVRQPEHRKHAGYVRGMRHGVLRDGPYVAAYGQGGGKATVPEMQHALGIGWTDVREELTEAIPPEYTEHIGRAFLSRQ